VCHALVYFVMSAHSNTLFYQQIAFLYHYHYWNL